MASSMQTWRESRRPGRSRDGVMPDRQTCFVQRLETKGLSLVHLELTNTNLLNKNDNGGAPHLFSCMWQGLPVLLLRICWKHSIASWESNRMQESDCTQESDCMLEMAQGWGQDYHYMHIVSLEVVAEVWEWASAHSEAGVLVWQWASHNIIHIMCIQDPPTLVCTKLTTIYKLSTIKYKMYTRCYMYMCILISVWLLCTIFVMWCEE